MQLNRRSRTTSQLLAIPGGDAGTIATLKIMRRLVRDAKKTLLVRQTALSIVQNIPPKNWHREVAAIWAFVNQRIRYVRDINGVETLQTPEKTMEFGQGDCDDQSVLIASLLESIGHPTRFIALGFGPANYQHVFAETKIGNKWMPVETTEDWPLGYIPEHVRQRIVRRKVVYN